MEKLPINHDHDHLWGLFCFPPYQTFLSQSKYPYQYYLEQKQISCNTAHVNVITHDISLTKTKQAKNNTVNLNYNGKITCKSRPCSSLEAFLSFLIMYFYQNKYPYQYYQEQKHVSCNLAHTNVIITHHTSPSKTTRDLPEYEDVVSQV